MGSSTVKIVWWIAIGIFTAVCGISAAAVSQGDPVGLRSSSAASSGPGYCGERWDAALQTYPLRARYYQPASGTFPSPDTHEGSVGETPTHHRYAYSHGDPVNHVDPSGHLTLTELQASLAVQFKLASETAVSVYRGYHTVMSTVDALETVMSLAKVVNGGALKQVMAEVQREFIRGAIRLNGEEIADHFVENFPRAAVHAPASWAPPMFLDLAAGKKMNAFLIYLPTPIHSGEINIPTGLKVGQRKVELVAGGTGSGRMLGLGVRMDQANKQFMRMDFHSPSPFHGSHSGKGPRAVIGDELDLWTDSPFHFHVLQYKGKSNR